MVASYLQTWNSISVHLDDTNYPTWVYLMQHFLRSRGLLKFVDGSFSTSNTTATESWMEQDSSVISMITASLSPEALTLVVGCQTSLEVWSTLKQHYAPTSEFHIMKLKSTLHTIRKGSDSIDKYLLRFKDVQNQLDVIGNKVSDGDLKALILAGLPREYGFTRQIIRSKQNIEMEELRSLLLSAEFEIELQRHSSTLPSLPNVCVSQGLQWNGSGVTTGVSFDNGFEGSHAIFTSQTAYMSPHVEKIPSGLVPPDGNQISLPSNYGLVQQPLWDFCTMPNQAAYNVVGAGYDTTLAHTTCISSSSTKDMDNEKKMTPITTTCLPKDAIAHTVFGDTLYANMSRQQDDDVDRVITCQVLEIMNDSNTEMEVVVQQPSSKMLTNYDHKEVSEASTSSVCGKVGQPATKCVQTHKVASSPYNTSHLSSAIQNKYAFPSQLSAGDKISVATACTYSTPLFIIPQPADCASQSQVQPLQLDQASPLSSPIHSSLQQLLTKSTSNNRLHSYPRFRTSKDCSNACETKDLWRSVPLIPPG